MAPTYQSKGILLKPRLWDINLVSIKKRFIHDETNYSTHNPKLKQLWLVEVTHNKKKKAAIYPFISIYFDTLLHTQHAL